LQHTPDEVQAEVIRLLQPLNPRGIEISPETDLAADLDMESVAAMNLMMEIEERFDIDMPISLLPEVNSLQDLVDVVLAQMSKGHPH
jgi:acyl carrier protein